MVNSDTLLHLSQQLRTRYNLCREALTAESGRIRTPQDFDSVFWGEPAEWDETLTPTDTTLANLLFPLVASPPQQVSEGEYDYPRVFASFLDDCYSIRNHSGKYSEWKEIEKFAPFQENVYRSHLSTYTDNSPKTARWIIVGGSPDMGHKPRKTATLPIFKPRTPCLDGVSLHADLTWDALIIHIRCANFPTPRRLELPRWGIGHNLKQVDKRFTLQENTAYIKEMLAKNVSAQITTDEGLTPIHPKQLQVDTYINRLRHLLPYAPEHSIRLTGWFSGALMQNQAKTMLSGRFKDIQFTYPYDSWSYE